MAIRVECPGCRSTFGVRDDFAGRRGKCPKCKAVVEVPAAAEPAHAGRQASPPPEAVPETYELEGAAPKAAVRRPPKGEAPGAVEARPTRRAHAPAEILAALRGSIEPVRPTPAHRLWVAVVAVAMVLLPVIYLAMVGLVAAAVIWHAVNNVDVFASARGRGGAKGAFLLYATPIAVGSVVVAFMLKPLFARPAKPPGRRALDPEKEPLLFAFVDGVCAAVGAPRPSRIEVDCQVNAGARIDNNPLAPRKQLVLTIGLPLVAGLELKEFAGVLAHEFGHFSQGASMRLTYVIGTVNHWFARVVYQRDAWDESLASWSSQGNVYTMMLGWVATLAVWLTRRALWALMTVGHALSGFLSRQMEFDADRYEARMVGGAVFAKTCWRLRELNLAQNGAQADLGSSWRQRRLPDDLPKLIIANVPQIPREALDAYRKEMGTRKTGFFDTHPADKDRIARARAEAKAKAGIFTLDGPATDVFRNFDSLSKRVTYEYYRELLGPQVGKEQLFPVSEMVETQAVSVEGHEAYKRYFLQALSAFQPLPLPEAYPSPPVDLKAAKRALVAARGKVESARDDNLVARKDWGDAFDRVVMAQTASILLKGGNRIKAADYGLVAPRIDAAEDALKHSEAAARAATAVFAPFSEASANRLSAALGLLETGALIGRVPDGPAVRDEARALYPSVAHLGGRVVASAEPMIRARSALLNLVLIYNRGDNRANQDLVNALLRGAAALKDALEEFKWRIGDVIPFPFEHAQEGISLGKFILPKVPPKEDIGDLLEASQEAFDRLVQVYGRALGRLAIAAEEVEKALGLVPIEVAPVIDLGEAPPECPPP